MLSERCLKMIPILSKGSGQRKGVLAFVCLLLICVGVCAVTLAIDCARRNSPPSAPVYPQSTLVSQKVDGLKSRYPIATYYYVSVDSPADLVAFYRDRGSCQESRAWKRAVCHGGSTPFGEFFAYIDLASHQANGTTSYVIEIRWQTCAPYWG